MQALFVKNHRNAQAAIFHEELLDGVGEFRHAARVLPLAGIAGTPHLPKPAPLLECGLGFGCVEIAAGIHQRVGFPLPDAHHLRGFFFQGHPGKEILHPLGSGQRGVPVGCGLTGGRHIVVDYNYNGWTV